ncbi:MAG: DUF1549 domain-containing protein [Planctomycetota bacterium]
MPRHWPVLLAISLTPAPAMPAGPSFTNEVMPILTRQGCNQGACHGKGAGQNGFRLSLRGYAHEQDIISITREYNGRRIDRNFPARSLLLTKASGSATHEGGRVFSPESREHATLMEWIKAGSPGPEADEPRISKLEVTPQDRILKVGDRIHLKATATFTDGGKRDVTWLTRFDANEPAIAEVTPAGEVLAKRNGAASVRAAFLTEVAVASFTIPHESAVDPSKFQARNNFIDDHVFPRLKDLRIEPSEKAGDAEFLRRIFLDLTGTLPTPAEVRSFLADNDPAKRDKLIDSLIGRPEFVDYWTLFLGDLMQNRKERDHDVRGVKGVRQFHEWLRAQVAANRPWDALARDVLTATGKTTDAPAIGYFIVTVGEFREQEKSEVAESVAQAFLGTRIGCARCHNHPLERYTQDDFYHFSAFFSRVKLDRKNPKEAPTALAVAPRDANDRRPPGVSQPRTRQYLQPRPLDRSEVKVAPGADPRVSLVEWMTNPANEHFAAAMSNRVWKHFMGVGLVEPVDDLRATNPPSNPGLFKALAGEFAGHGHDLRHLIRVIVKSRAYQLTSATLPGNQAETRFYSHYHARRLPAEVLLDAICQATGVPERFDGYPEGVRALQVPDPGVNSAFLRMFGRSERVTACTCERSGEVTMPQLLHLRNGERMIEKLASPGGVLGRLLAGEKDDDRVIDELFLRTLSRLPESAEKMAVRKALEAGDPRADVFRDLFWALLNAKSFAFNS